MWLASQKERRENGLETTFKEIMADDFPKITKDIKMNP